VFWVAPKIFSIFYNICKLILNKNTIDKIRIYGHDKEEWTRALLEEIDADQLPVYYGGKLTDPDGDPKCPSKVGTEISVSEKTPLDTYNFLI